ncbi:MAG: DNA alkylation repair protein [bacterium]|nr:MAG: DNA alkylation repair protein [bacterium]
MKNRPPSPSIEQVLDLLRAEARPENLEGMARFGMTINNRLGVSVPIMRKIARQTKKNHPLALELWETGIAEARIVAALIAEPHQITESQMETWVKDFDSWDVCDQVCMNLFDKVPLAWKKVLDWSKREEEFVRRAAFTLIACLAWHDKEAPDEKFRKLLPVIEGASTDPRNFVKKSVNWALRHIGKRNLTLNKDALKTAYNIRNIDSKTSRWIASDAIRELESPAVQKRLREKK